MTFKPSRSRFANRGFIGVLGVFAFLYVSICVYFWGTQVDKILAPLADKPSDPWRMGMSYEDVRIPLHHVGENRIEPLYAFWVPAENAEAPVFLYLHGQDATRGKNLEHTERFHQWGWNVLVIDYRGFGESYDKEKPSEAKVYEDALAALEYLKLDRGFPSNKIFIYGHSLGGAVAIELATRAEAADTAGLIVESTFTSILDMSAYQYSGFLELLPVDLLLTERFESLRKIDSIKRPILVIHGTHDPKVPHKMSQTLSDKAGASAKLCLIEGAGHENCGSIGKVQYRKSLDEFVATCLVLAEPLRL